VSTNDPEVHNDKQRFIRIKGEIMVALGTNSSDCFTRIGNYFFSDICNFSRTLYLSHGLKVTQLRIQPLECQYTILDYDCARFLFFNLNSPILFTGKASENYVQFGCVLQSYKTSIIVQENMISSEMLFGLNADRNFQILLPPNTAFCIFQIPNSVFKEKLLQYKYQALLDKLESLYFCSPEKSLKLRSFLTSLYHQVRQTSIKNRQNFEPISKKSVAEDFFRLLIDSLPSRSNASQRFSKPHLKNLRRAEIVYEAVAILRANLHQQIQVKDLAKELNVSKRALLYGFKEICGIGPMKFLKIERLQHIRQALKEADPEFSKVFLITEQFGIYSPGHFAKDYQQMFGETPSETLKRQS
jgi:AraC family ethanolamine operon transcriptional activator